MTTIIKCPKCRGTGLDETDNFPCKKCLGYGELIEFGQGKFPETPFPETEQDNKSNQPTEREVL